MPSLKIKIGIIGGSGLDNPDIFKITEEVSLDTPYGQPSDALRCGKIEGVDCVLLARHGRRHDINPTNVNYRANIWALKKIGCTHLIVSSACGSLKEEIAPGDLVVVDSFIDRVQTFFDGGVEPGVCHLPMEPAFCEKTRKLIISTAKELKMKVHDQGVVVTIEGPRFSSKAESNLFRSWGASLVNMTLIPELALAKEKGICYAAVAMATDYDCWRGSTVDVAEVEKTMKENCHKIIKLFNHLVPKIAAEDWEATIKHNEDMIKGSNMLKEK